MIRNVFRNNRPFVLEYAPNIAASICGNRQVNTQTETGGGFNAYADPIDVVALQNDCGDPSFVIDKVMKKKKKKPRRRLNAPLRPMLRLSAARPPASARHPCDWRSRCCRPRAG